MRHIILLVIVSMLLAACSASAPQTATGPTDIPTVPETTAATLPIQPPDPLQMLLDSMTVEEKVGQLFLARCPSENAAEDIGTYHL
jgi:beta-N-acetylhexosaminidase